MEALSSLNVLFVVNSIGTIGRSSMSIYPEKVGEFVKGVKIIELFHIEGQDVAESNREVIRLVGKTMKEKSSAIAKVIENWQPDLIHTYFFGKDSYLLPILVNREVRSVRPKWILDIRSPVLHKGSKRMFSKLFGLAHQIWYDAIFTHVLASAHDVIPFIIKPLFFIPPGVETSAFKKHSVKAPTEVIRFIYTGSIYHKRKLDKLIYGIHYALQRYTGSLPVQIDFFGDGDAVEYLQYLVVKMGLERVVSFKGLIPQKDLFKQLQNYHYGFAYVPNGMYENAPLLKALEYMAAGLIVLGSDTKGNRLYLKNEVNGILFQNKSDHIGRTVLFVLNHSYNTDIAEKGRLEVLKWDWNYVTERYLLRAYRNVLQ